MHDRREVLALLAARYEVPMLPDVWSSLTWDDDNSVRDFFAQENIHREQCPSEQKKNSTQERLQRANLLPTGHHVQHF